MSVKRDIYHHQIRDICIMLGAPVDCFETLTQWVPILYEKTPRKPPSIYSPINKEQLKWGKTSTPVPVFPPQGLI